MIVTSSQRLLGIFLLVFVNVIWVVSAEITRYLFIDLAFSRPFFFTYAKSCMLSLFLLRYACVCTAGGVSAPASSAEKKSTRTKAGKAVYTRLVNSVGTDEDGVEAEINNDLNNNSSWVTAADGLDEDSESYERASLTSAEFEQFRLPPPATDDSELCTEEEELLKADLDTLGEAERQLFDILRLKKERQRRKRVRFSSVRQVRALPEKVEADARAARMPFSSARRLLDCSSASICPARDSAMFAYAVYFAPLWMISSVSAQTSLAYATVATVNLVGASCPLFVLLLGTFFGRHSADAFNYTKLALVLLNFAGVCVVSRFSGSVLGSSIALFSSFSNAVYLFALARFSEREEHVDTPLLIGIVGIFSLVVCTPLMVILHNTGIEPQLPLPTMRQMGILVFNAFIGTLFADSIWLYATLLTGGLTSSLSGSLGIPLSMLADSIFRNQPPNVWQILSAIPITISFIGASIVTAGPPQPPKSSSAATVASSSHNHNHHHCQPLRVPSTSSA